MYGRSFFPAFVLKRLTSTSPPCSPSTSLIVTLSTAHPAKFLSAVQSALPSLDFEREVMPDELRGIEERERRVEFVTGGEQGVRKVVERFAEGGHDVGAKLPEEEAPVVAAA
jgi:hypothetical protein